MEAMKLNEQERRLYTHLFGRFDVDNSGKLSIRSVGELFGSSGLSPELLHQITDLSGAKKLGYFGKVQFYIALKLIAAAQSGLPLTLESLTAASELPLPMFNRTSEPDTRQYQQLARMPHSSYTIIDSRDAVSQMTGIHDQRVMQQQSSQMTQPLPPPPTVQRRASRSNPSVDIRSAHKLAMRTDEASQSFTDTISPPMSPQQQYIVAVPQSPLGLTATHSQPYATFVPSVPPHGITYPPASAVPMPQAYGTDMSYGAPMIYGPVTVAQHPVVMPQQQQQQVALAQHMAQQSAQAAAVQHVQPSVPVHVIHAPPVAVQQQPQQATSKTQWLHSAATIHGDGGGAHSPQSEKSWAMFDDDGQGLISSERKEGSHFADSKADTSSVSSEAESVDDVWTISDEQRDYYVNQFLKLQPDLQGMVSGSVAKDFFEKSRLPISELSKIWALADINQDGALTLDEFCIAMHLVVLRRNNIDLPSRLPRSLMPYDRMPLDEDIHGGTLKRSPSPTQSEQQQWSATFTAVESPSSSSISTSPGSKPTPANFEFRPIVVDPERKIVQPLPVRISPDHLQHHHSDADSGDVGDIDDVDSRHPQRRLAADQVSVHSEQLIDFESDVVSPASAANKQQQPGTSQHDGAIGAGQSQESNTHLPSTEVIRPMTLPGLSRWNGLKEPTDTTALLQSTSKQSVSTASSEAYLAPLDRSKATYESLAKSKTSITSEDNSDIISLGASYVRPNDKKSLKQAIRKQKEKNVMLSRLNGELNQELQELMEQRIALEIQLEHLRPFYS